VRPADHYHGGVALGYEQQRAHKSDWNNQQAAVDRFLRFGPVLDVPFGTGRYVPIYRFKGMEFVGVDISDDMLSVAKAKYPGIDARRGSILNLEFSDKSFETGVCTRMLNWFYPEEMLKAMSELKRVCKRLILSIHTGTEGNKSANGTYTHSFSKFMEACDGLLIDGRAEVAPVRGGMDEVFHLRPATWGDVLDQFANKKDPIGTIRRLTAVWVRRMAMPPVDMSENGVMVRACSWTHLQLGALLEKMLDLAKKDPTMRAELLTNERPAHQDRPLTILSAGGQYAGIDGRRRMNIWKDIPGRYPVLLVEPR
jgi:SAM-dependent methyltransferase